MRPTHNADLKHVPSGSWIQPAEQISQAIIALRVCIDLSTWCKAFPQSAAYVIVIPQSLPWPTRKKSREILTPTVTLASELRLT